MPDDQPTHFTLVDGTIVPITYITEEELPEDLKRLSESAKAASRDAIRRLHEQGLPAPYLKGKHLVYRYPDGHEEIIQRDIIP